MTVFPVYHALPPSWLNLAVNNIPPMSTRTQLQHRFGSVPAWVEDQLAQATPAQLEQWGLRVLQSKTLLDVFKI